MPSPVPQSTYRLQLQPGFGFTDAAGIAGYLAALGVTHAYLSPILQAMPGSVHGYDVVDHSRLSPANGYQTGTAAFAPVIAGNLCSGGSRDSGISDIAPTSPHIPSHHPASAIECGPGLAGYGAGR